MLKHSKGSQTPFPAIPLNAVCPLVGNLCYYNNFVFYDERTLLREINTLNTAKTEINVTFTILQQM